MNPRDLHIERRAIDALIPYARNSRTHSEAQIAQIAASIQEFGWTNPVLVDGENGIIAGHGRQDYHWIHEPCLYGWKDGAGHLSRGVA